MKKTIATIILALSLSALAYAEVSTGGDIQHASLRTGVAPHTLHSISMGYIRDLERTADAVCRADTIARAERLAKEGVARANRSAARKVAESARYETMSSELREFIETEDKLFSVLVVSYHRRFFAALGRIEDCSGIQFTWRTGVLAPE